MFVGLVSSSDTSVWAKFNKILGEKKMFLSFESADVFGNTMQGETEMFGKNHLSCFTYKNGEAFGELHHEDIAYAVSEIPLPQPRSTGLSGKASTP